MAWPLKDSLPFESWKHVRRLLFSLAWRILWHFSAKKSYDDFPQFSYQVVKLLEVQPYQLDSLLHGLVSNQVTFHLARYTSRNLTFSWIYVCILFFPMDLQKRVSAYRARWQKWSFQFSYSHPSAVLVLCTDLWGTCFPSWPVANCRGHYPLQPERQRLQKFRQLSLPGARFDFPRCIWECMLGIAPFAADKSLLEKSSCVSTVLLKFWWCWGRSNSCLCFDKAPNNVGPSPGCRDLWRGLRCMR